MSTWTSHASSCAFALTFAYASYATETNQNVNLTLNKSEVMAGRTTHYSKEKRKIERF
jgi:hypothetical protein